MTDDLVKRLRGWRGYHQANLSVEAADRIEALTAERDAADALIDAQAKDHASNNIRFAEATHRAEKAEADNARLQNAIDDIVCGRGMFGLDPAQDLQWAMKTAGAALALIEKPAHVNETAKSEHDAANMLTPATKGGA